MYAIFTRKSTKKEHESIWGIFTALKRAQAAGVAQTMRRFISSIKILLYVQVDNFPWLSNSFISFSFIIIIISVLLCNKGDKGEPY
jgi:hypothetical protein